MESEPRQPRLSGRNLAFVGMGMEMIAPIAVGFLLDSYLGWLPWLTLSGLALGFISSMTHLIFVLRQRGDLPPRRQRDKT